MSNDETATTRWLTLDAANERIAAQLEEIHQLGAEMLQLKAQLEDRDRTAAGLRRIIDARTKDLNILADAIYYEAQNRDWCDEYNSWANRVNAATSDEWIQLLPSEQNAEFKVSLRFMAADRDEAVGEIQGYLEGVDSVGYEVSDVTVEER